MEPKKARILGNTFTITAVKSGPMGLSCSGYNDHKKCRIYYDEGWSEGKKRETVLHEIIHEIDEQGYLELKEKQVHALSALLLAVARENPKVFEWIFEPA